MSKDLKSCLKQQREVGTNHDAPGYIDSFEKEELNERDFQRQHLHLGTKIGERGQRKRKKNF